MERPWPEADTDDSPAARCKICPFPTKGALNARLLCRNKDIHIRPMHHFFGVIRVPRFLPANCPNVFDERRQIRGRLVGLEAHMTFITDWVQAPAWLVILCGFL